MGTCVLLWLRLKSVQRCRNAEMHARCFRFKGKVRDLAAKKYQSGQGYENPFLRHWIYSATLYRQSSKTGILLSTACLYKIGEKTRRKVISEAAKMPTATLKEWQPFVPSAGCSLHVTTISWILYTLGYRVGWQERSLFSPKTHPC